MNDSLPNTPLGRIQVVDLNGRGMGEVHRGRDTSLGRDRAIKILPAQLTRDTRLAAVLHASGAIR